jgi:predicted permease
VSSTLAVVTLGLGIGGTTAMFSVVDGVLVRDLPYRDPGSLVSVWKAWPSWQGVDGLDYVWDHIHIPWRDYLHVRDGATTLSDVAAHQNDGMVLTGTGEPEELSVGMASANLFDLLGVRPILGRTFAPGEVPPEGDAAPLVVLSHEIWARRFGADRRVVGSTVRLDGLPHEVIGVLPPGFRLGSDLLATHENAGTADPGLRDLWAPLGLDGVDCGNCFELLARLAPGRSIEDARADVQRLMTVGPSDQIALVVPRKDMVTAGFGTPLLMLLGAAGVLLLIACTNVAGLLLGEAAGRRQEISVRVALGAGRGRILRQLLTESVVLGLAGSAAGVALAWLGTDALLALAPPLPRLEEVGLSRRVLAFAVLCGAGTGILFGLAPALSLASGPTAARLHGRRGASDQGARSLQGTVVALQVAMTVVLLVAGGLFGRSLARVMAVDPGFAPDRLAALSVSPPPGHASEPTDLDLLHAELVAALLRVPGVESVATVNTLPFPGGVDSHAFQFDRAGERVVTTQWARRVSTSYFETMRIPLLLGRLLSDDDGPADPGAMLVSESLAERNWPGESPLGATIRYMGREWTVVGVVGDVRQRALGAPVEATFYTSVRQLTGASLSIAVRTTADPAAAVPALRAAIRAVDPDIPITEATTMRVLMRESEADDRFRALLMWTFAGLATALAAVGIFGVTARAVASRSHELGIRTALGARAAGLVGLVIRDGLPSVLAGTLGGLVGAYWLASLIGHLLYGVGARDPATYGSVAGLVVLVCLAAAYLPARRVTRISPSEVIAEE